MELWRKQILNRITTVSELDRRIGLTDNEKKNITEVTGKFRMGITPYYLGLIDKKNPNCPIRRQAVPSINELNILEGELDDPIGDIVHSPVKGVVHRYPDRVLLFPTYACASYCRHCFRRRIAGRNDRSLSSAELKSAIQYIRSHKEITEVILSGGDSLLLTDESLEKILKSIKKIRHVRWIRIHTRVLATLPHRITPRLIKILKEAKPVIVVTHLNHPEEITPLMRKAVKRISDSGIMLLNQSVLLRGVNDNADILRDLFTGLTECGVKPYYLHQCDPAKGISHFRVPLKKGIGIMKELRGSMPGVCVPVYMVEIPGGRGKMPVDCMYGENAGFE